MAKKNLMQKAAANYYKKYATNQITINELLKGLAEISNKNYDADMLIMTILTDVMGKEIAELMANADKLEPEDLEKLKENRETAEKKFEEAKKVTENLVKDK